MQLYTIYLAVVAAPLTFSSAALAATAADSVSAEATAERRRAQLPIDHVSREPLQRVPGGRLVRRAGGPLPPAPRSR